MIRLGKMNVLEIARKSDYGLYLADERGSEVLLPNAYVTPRMRKGDRLEVFVHHDSEDRLVATTLQPKAMLDQFGFFEVVGVSRFGAFVDWGLPKDLLVPKRFQKEPFRIGEKKFLRIVYDERTHRLVATQRYAKYLDNEPKGLKPNEELEALVVKESDLGWNCIVEDRYEGLLYRSEVFESIEVGEKRAVYLKKKRSDGKLDLSLRKMGAKATKNSQEKILSLLRQNGGKLPYNSKSAPEAIVEFFGMSKKEFKRSLSILREKKLIEVDSLGMRFSNHD